MGTNRQSLDKDKIQFFKKLGIDRINDPFIRLPSEAIWI